MNVRSARRRLWVDAALALLTFAVVCFAPATVGAPVTWEGPFTLGAALGAALMLRRRAPLGVLALSAVLLFAFRASGLYEMGLLWPLSPALVTAVAAGQLKWDATAGAFGLAYGLEVLFGDLGAAETAARVGTEALWIGLLFAGATAWRQYTQRRAEQDARVAQEERTLLAEQRLEISREVHDVVAHTLAVVGVHLNVAADALTDDPDDPDAPGVDLEAARAALRTAREARGAAMAELKAFVGDLRGAPQAALPGIEALLDAARAAGLDVAFDRHGDLAAVPTAQSLAAYQVVREAVTNALRHSGAARLAVSLAADPDALRVVVADDGTASSPVVPGHGLTGMRERAAALGGSVRWESGDGFTVRAVLPRGVGGSAA